MNSHFEKRAVRQYVTGMEWIVFGLGAIVVGAAGLALYEHRKGLRIVVDDCAEPARSAKRRADVESERIRVEGAISQNIGGGDGTPQ